MRSVWKGKLGFHLVGLNVKLYKATEDTKASFHLMHPTCTGRVKMQYFCPACNKTVERTELKKGYEFAKEQYVILDESDFERLPLKSLKQIDILGFAKDSLDPRAFDTTYYLTPDKGGENVKPFWLLYRVMERGGLKAIGKLAYREREHLCVIYPYDGIFLLQTLCYAEEVRPYQDLKPTAVALSERELGLGETLVKEWEMIFDHSAFQNEYVKALEAMITAKIAGKEIAVPAEAEAPIGDLVAQLLASIGAK